MDKYNNGENYLRDEILVEPEEPILTLNFNCSSDDYRYSLEMWPKKYNQITLGELRIRLVMAIVITIIFGSVLPWNYLFHSQFRIFNIFILIVVISLMINQIYVIHCIKHQNSILMHLITRKNIKKLNLVYVNRTIKEIKNIMIPCQYRFFDTYLIKSIPALESMNQSQPEKIIDLPLTVEVSLDYSEIIEIYENKKCITFGKKVFFPKYKMNIEQREHLDLIIEKICLLNSIKK